MRRWAWKTHKELKLGKAEFFQQTLRVSSDGPCVRSSGNLSCTVNSLAAFTFISVQPGLQSPANQCCRSVLLPLERHICLTSSADDHLKDDLFKSSLLLKGALSPWRVGEMHPSLPTAVPASHSLVYSKGGLHSSSGGVWQDGHWDTRWRKRGLQAFGEWTCSAEGTIKSTISCKVWIHPSTHGSRSRLCWHHLVSCIKGSCCSVRISIQCF